MLQTFNINIDLMRLSIHMNYLQIIIINSSLPICVSVRQLNSQTNMNYRQTWPKDKHVYSRQNTDMYILYKHLIYIYITTYTHYCLSIEYQYEILLYTGRILTILLRFGELVFTFFIHSCLKYLDNYFSDLVMLRI
jgi:hypothetical protein